MNLRWPKRGRGKGRGIGVGCECENRRGFARLFGERPHSVVPLSCLGWIGIVAASVAADVIPGIKQYQVVLPEFSIGPAGQAPAVLQDSVKNMAGDISDRGLIAGRVQLVTPGLRAFAWSTVPQYGLVQSTVTWLPMPTDELSLPFATSEAFDVSEYGVVLGGVGPIVGLVPTGGGSTATSDWKARGILWRLGAGDGGVATWQRIDPPSGSPHGDWPQGAAGITVLEAISAELPLRAVGYAGSAFGCMGPVGTGLPAAFAVELAAGTLIPQYWTDPMARPTSEGAPKGRALGISRRGEFVVGGQNSSLGCDPEPVQYGIPCAPTRWDRGSSPDTTALTPTDIGGAVPPGETLTAEVRGVSRIGYGSADGICVGYIFRAVGAQASEFPYAWKIPPAVSTDPQAPPAQPLQLPIPPGSTELGGLVDDLERARWLSGASTTPFHIAVGKSEPFLLSDESVAAIWFWSGASWTEEAWTAVDVNSPGVLLGDWKSHPSDRIERLRGVNQWGDCVGTAIVSGVRHPVVLRAVRLDGDLDINDCVGATDLAILMSAWCASENCSEPNFAADLNRDGIIGSADLSALLANWGAGIGCPAGAVESPVPALVAAASKRNVDFSAYFIGLEDIEGYRAWAATAPPATRRVIDEVMWLIAKSRQESGNE